MYFQGGPIELADHATPAQRAFQQEMFREDNKELLFTMRIAELRMISGQGAFLRWEFENAVVESQSFCLRAPEHTRVDEGKCLRRPGLRGLPKREKNWEANPEWNEECVWSGIKFSRNAEYLGGCSARSFCPVCIKPRRLDDAVYP